MGNVSFGVDSIEIGDINATTGLGENYASIGDVYKDTCEMNQEEAEKTMHFAELKTNPVVVIAERGAVMLIFELLNVYADDLVQYLGGTVTDGNDSPDIWNQGRENVNIEKALKITADDGTIFEFMRVHIDARVNSQFTKKGIFRIIVEGTVLTPEVVDVPPMTITNNYDEPAV